ncbi:membrane protein [Luteipulveratus mongoliensis]|uniref:Membrane protein n=2 Tax=Luteipulveratus mongoliensis TaxID=571913 RepID=A0A0K1JPM8_9MICO|nr:membrane protein [Luteipulveratus mongoliensis]
MTVKVVSAVVILIVTWILAKVVKNLLSKVLQKVSFLNRQTDGETLAASLGSIGSLVIWLFGLVAVLNVFKLNEAVTPIQGMLDDVLGAIPNILAAGLIFFIGFVLAKIVRDLVVTALQAANVDRFADKLNQKASAEVAGVSGDVAQGTDGASRVGDTSTGGAGQLRISTLVGQILFVVVLAVVSISAFDALGIKAISEPATDMLTKILDAIPAILGAAILLTIGVVIARIVGNLLESVLRGFGVQRAVEGLGVEAGGRDVAAIGAKVAQVAIVLFFAIAATKMLNFPEITNILNTVLALGGKVLFGAVVIVVGVFIANLLAKTIGTGQTAQIVRYGTIALFVAMGLKYMGLADSIVNLAFGAIVVGGAAAAALAFGLGGRDAAARQLQKLQDGKSS